MEILANALKSFNQTIVNKQLKKVLNKYNQVNNQQDETYKQFSTFVDKFNIENYSQNNNYLEEFKKIPNYIYI